MFFLHIYGMEFSYLLGIFHVLGIQFFPVQDTISLHCYTATSLQREHTRKHSVHRKVKGKSVEEVGRFIKGAFWLQNKSMSAKQKTQIKNKRILTTLTMGFGMHCLSFVFFPSQNFPIFVSSPFLFNHLLTAVPYSMSCSLFIALSRESQEK